MDYTGLLGDAFHADEQKSNKRYGLSLQKDHEDIVFGSRTEFTSIDPKCNTVCLMKSDKRNYRNMIAVSENYICYTVKGNLLRVIESVTGEKVLLRGHESPVLDVRFSPVNKNVLCSVDAGDGASSHVYLWQLQTDKSTNAVEQTLLFSLSLKANNVKSHPLTANFWAISYGNQLGLFHVDLDEGVQSYDNLAFHLLFKDEVIDFCFSPDGLYMAVITGAVTGAGAVTSIGIFRLAGGGDVEHLQAGGQYGLVPYSTIPSPQGQTFSGISFICPVDNSSDVVLVTLSASNGEEGSSGVSNVHVWNLKDGKRVLDQSLSLTVPQTAQKEHSAFPSRVLTVDTSEGKFLSVSSKCSTIVACLGISNDAGCNRLYHCSFLNLKFCVSSIVNTTVHVREKDEASRVPEAHVGITCFQDQQNGQHAVQQYHVPSRWLFQQACPKLSDVAVVPAEVKTLVHSDNSSSSLLKGILFSTPSDLSSTSNDTPQLKSNVATCTNANHEISILSKEDGLLSTLPVGSFPDFALISTPDHVPSISTNSAPISTSQFIPKSSTEKQLPSQQVDIGVKSKQILLNALKVHPTTSPHEMNKAPPTTISASTNSKKAVNITNAPSGESYTIKTSTASTTSSIPSPIVVPSKEVCGSSKLDEDEDDNWEKASISITRSQPSTPVATTSEGKTAVAVDYESKFNELLSVTYRMQEQIASLEEKTVLAEKQRNKKSNKQADMPAGMLKMLGDMKVEIVQDVLHGVSTMVEQQSHQAVANILSSEKWRQQVSADLRQELAPALSQTIRTAVKENIKGSIVESFRYSFETTIVPAYEAGSRELFSQLQGTYTAGVEVMKADNKRISEANHSETVALRNEVSSLRNTVANLETKMLKLFNGTLDESNTTEVVQYETDYKQLYLEGRIGESLEVALELKDIDSVLWVLKQQVRTDAGLSDLFEKSSALSDVSILCAVQQLAADLAFNEPEEGIRSRMECLKEMIMYLIDDHLPEAENISQIVTSTLDNLKIAEAKHTLVGAARTDMKMLCSILLSNF